MKIAYLDCFSGISGDMLLGAILDAGLPFDKLKRALATLPLDGYTLETSREERNHLSGTRFMVKVEANRQVPRGLEDIKGIIQAGGLSEKVKGKSIEIFDSIAGVEGKIHQCPPEKVHFHELGATDSIIDIVGSVFGLDSLGIHSLCASPLPLGSGFVETQHGRIPLPAPATIALLKDVPVYGSGVHQELITPTGAALLKGLVTAFGPLPSMVIDGVGYGVGSRNLPDRPNLLRLIIGRDQAEQDLETVVMLEANLDDVNPEWLGFLMDRLLKAGALDVLFCPVQMKKNRPGVVVQVMGRPEDKDALMAILFTESTTLGIRFHFSQRKILKRSIAEIESPWGKLKVKRVQQLDGSFTHLPEYEACRKIAEDQKVPLKEVYYWVMSHNRTRTS